MAIIFQPAMFRSLVLEIILVSAKYWYISSGSERVRALPKGLVLTEIQNFGVFRLS